MLVPRDNISQLAQLTGSDSGTPEQGDNLIRVVSALDASQVPRALRLAQAEPIRESHCTTLSVYANAANATANYQLMSGLWELRLGGYVLCDFTDLSGGNDQDVILIAPGTEQNQLVGIAPQSGVPVWFEWGGRFLLTGGVWTVRARGFAGALQHARIILSIQAQRIL